jgi:hypothetical protein
MKERAMSDRGSMEMDTGGAAGALDPRDAKSASGADASRDEYSPFAEVDLGHGSGDPNRPIVDEHGAVGISRGSGEGSIGETAQ